MLTSNMNILIWLGFTVLPPILCFLLWFISNKVKHFFRHWVNRLLIVYHKFPQFIFENCSIEHLPCTELLYYSIACSLHNWCISSLDFFPLVPLLNSEMNNSFGTLVIWVRMVLHKQLDIAFSVEHDCAGILKVPSILQEMWQDADAVYRRLPLHILCLDVQIYEYYLQQMALMAIYTFLNETYFSILCFIIYKMHITVFQPFNNITKISWTHFVYYKGRGYESFDALAFILFFLFSCWHLLHLSLPESTNKFDNVISNTKYNNANWIWMLPEK